MVPSWVARNAEGLSFVVALVALVAVLFSFDVLGGHLGPLILLVAAFGLVAVKDVPVAVTAAIPYALLYGVTLIPQPTAAALVSMGCYVYGLYFLIARDSAIANWRRLVLRRPPMEEPPGR